MFQYKGYKEFRTFDGETKDYQTTGPQPIGFYELITAPLPTLCFLSAAITDMPPEVLVAGLGIGVDLIDRSVRLTSEAEPTIVSLEKIARRDAAAQTCEPIVPR